MLQQSLLDDISQDVSACKMSHCWRRLHCKIHFLLQVPLEQAVSLHTEVIAGCNEDDAQVSRTDSFQSLAVQFSHLSIWASQIQYPGSDLYLFSWLSYLHLQICLKACKHWLPAMSSWSLAHAKHKRILPRALLEGMRFVYYLSESLYKYGLVNEWTDNQNEGAQQAE